MYFTRRPALREHVRNRQRHCGGGGRNDDLRSTSTRRAAVKNRFGGDFIRRKLRLQVRAVIVETGDDGENNRGSKH